MKQIYIAYTNNGSEGMSKPLAAFSSKRLAEIYKGGANACNYGSVEIACLPVIEELEAEGPDEAAGVHSRAEEA